MKRVAILNSNTLKFIAAITMLIDHAGLILFPRYIIFRIVGRISFPIYAFMIAEGCRYTKNKVKHFLCIFGLGVLCQAVFQITTGVEYMGILITFSLSVILVNVLLDFKKQLYHGKWAGRVLCAILFCLLIVLAVVLTEIIPFDYGITGVLLPVILTMPSLATSENGNNSAISRFIDSNITRCILLAVALVSFSFVHREPIYLYSLMSVPLLLLYSGKCGRLKLKWFFYIFYPAHLVLISATDYLAALLLKFI